MDVRLKGQIDCQAKMDQETGCKEQSECQGRKGQVVRLKCTRLMPG